MYDTARRVALVKQRVRENTRRRQRREAISLSAFCLMLFTALAGAADALIVRGQTAARGMFGAMLLREDAGGYVLVGVVCFAAAAAITALCFRSDFTPYTTLPYHCLSTILSFGCMLSPVIFSAQSHSTSDLLRTLLMNGCF